jgi:phosphoribosyl-ATP pyrophosphohydrolase
MNNIPFVMLPAAEPGHTDTIRYDVFVAGLFKLDPSPVMNRLHAAVGISGEAGELLDAVKKEWVYNKPLDYENVKEELGDLMFYITAMMIYCGISWQEVFQYNADKLAKRYVGLKYSDQAAQERADKNV